MQLEIASWLGRSQIQPAKTLKFHKVTPVMNGKPVLFSVSLEGYKVLNSTLYNK